MSVATALFLAVLVTQSGLKRHQEIDEAVVEQMQQHQEYLHQQMILLLQETEQNRDEEEAMLLSLLQHWLIKTIAGVLFWLTREMKLSSDICSEQDSSSSKEDEDEEEDLKSAHSGVRSFPLSTLSTMRGLPEMCKELKELVVDLLGASQVICRTFMLQMHPSIGMDVIYEASSVQKNSISRWVIS